MKRGAILGLAGLAAAAAAPAACGGGGGGKARVETPAVRAADAPGITLAIYKNLAVVRDVRRIELPPGGGELVWDGVPKLLDATSVTLRSHTDAAARPLDQEVVLGAATTEEVLARAIGRRVVVSTADGEVDGVLRAVDAGRLVVEVAGGPRVLSRIDQVQAVSLAEGAPASSRGPRIRWRVASERGGAQLVEVTYQTFGVRWSADYTVVLDEAATRADVAGWATIWNESGASFPSALVELRGEKMGDKSFASVGPATLGDREPVRVALPTPGRALAASRRLVYDGVGEAGIWKGTSIQPQMDYAFYDRTAVEEHLELGGVTASLPPGNATVYRRRDDGTLAWLGQDDLGPVVAGKPLRVRLGPAPKIRGARKQAEYAYERERKRLVEEIEVTLTNDGDEAREVVVLERLARGETWRVPWSSVPVEKEDTRTIRATLTVPPKGKARLAYRVIYGWK